MDFFDRVGKMAIGSRLRRLSDLLTEDAVRIYASYGVPLQPKWFPVYSVLAHGESKAISEIAAEIGHSHPSVSTIVREMSRAGLVAGGQDTHDKRKNVVRLSRKGRQIARRIAPQYRDVAAAVDTILAQTQHDLWKAIGEWEFLLGQQRLFDRVRQQKKARESRDVRIVDYQPKYAKAFKQLNAAWIAKYFKMEQPDYEVLDHPKEHVLKPGGHIAVALYHDKPVGVCALIRKDRTTYELAKMAVAPEAQGKNIGWMLGRACIDRARSLGARRLYLESNTILVPAIQLYHKLGFKKITGPPSPYERSNIQMELVLDAAT